MTTDVWGIVLLDATKSARSRPNRPDGTMKIVSCVCPDLAGHHVGEGYGKDLCCVHLQPGGLNFGQIMAFWEQESGKNTCSKDDASAAPTRGLKTRLCITTMTIVKPTTLVHKVGYNVSSTKPLLNPAKLCKRGCLFRIMKDYMKKVDASEEG